MLLIAVHVAFLSVAGAWLWVTLAALRGAAVTPTLAPADHLPDQPASVAIVVPARDEEKRVEATIRRCLAQRAADVRVFAVDDRSIDATSAILARIAAEDPRLEVIRIDVLPLGWLGKCHACHVGAERAMTWSDAEWLLFSDADTWLTDTVVARAVEYCRAQDSEHLLLIPGFAHTTLVGRAALAAAMQSFMHLAASVNRDRPLGYVGGGAFNFTTVAAYRRAGGHLPLRMEVVDDMRLGMTLRRAGARSRAAMAPHDVEVEWIASAAGFVRLLEKNYFALFNFSAVLAAGAVAGLLAVWALGIAGVFSALWSGWIASGAMLTFAVPCAITARRMGWSPWLGLASPLTLPLFAAAIANSAAKALRRGGIVWRETFYSLKELRAGMVR